MYIMSQNETRIVDISNASIELNLMDNSIYVCSTHSYNPMCVGQYNTIERAKEVLNEIFNLLNPFVCFSGVNNVEETKEMLADINVTKGIRIFNDDTCFASLNQMTYKMPKE